MKILDRLQELEQAATPGPWKADNDNRQIVFSNGDCRLVAWVSDEDRDIIAALRNAAPALIRVARAAHWYHQDSQKAPCQIGVCGLCEALKELEGGDGR